MLSEKDAIDLAPSSNNALHNLPADIKEDGDISGVQFDVEPTARRAIPLRYRLFAFSMIIFFNTSSSFSESTLSPLKSTIRKELGVTSTLIYRQGLTSDAQYGAISSASSLVNTILPVIGGIGIDYWGST